MKRLAITGGMGFLGWHCACRARALAGVDILRLGRQDFADIDRLTNALASVDGVLHLAGVNRAETDALVERGNIQAASTLADALRRVGRSIDVVYANSIQAEQDSPYGRGKAAAATILGQVVGESGGNFADLLLPNLFGEHGRPSYNSFVATFVHDVVQGRNPAVTSDREIDLLHVQRAAEELISSLGTNDRRVVTGHPLKISAVRDTLEEMHAIYATRGEIPNIASSFNRDLFNTYRAATFPRMWPIRPIVHADGRGELFEAVRSHGRTGMSFASTTRPGETRGDHYHLHKVERFIVVQGSAEIRLRRLLHDEIITFHLEGDRPAIVDMQTLWTHNIRHIGETDLITLFWADQLLDSSDPDQYPEPVSAAPSR